MMKFSDRLHSCGLVAVGPIAQSVEQRTFNPWVDGSSPSGPTFRKPNPKDWSMKFKLSE